MRLARIMSRTRGGVVDGAVHPPDGPKPFNSMRSPNKRVGQWGAFTRETLDRELQRDSLCKVCRAVLVGSTAWHVLRWDSFGQREQDDRP